MMLSLLKTRDALLKRKRAGGYIFTNKKHSLRGILSTFLGFISLVSVNLAVYFVYKSGESASVRYGAVGILSLLFSVLGIALGVRSRSEPDSFYLFSYLGLGLNSLAVFCIVFIMLAGFYGG